jgi:SnoaL-like domain
VATSGHGGGFGRGPRYAANFWDSAAGRRGRGVALLLLSMTIGCTSPREPEQAQRWAAAWVESLNSHRLQQVAPLLDPTATYQDPLTGKPLSGQGLDIFLTMLWNGSPESRYEVRSVNGTRDFLAVEWSATSLGALRVKGPIQGVFLMRFNDDHITSVRGYYDTAALVSGVR